MTQIYNISFVTWMPLTRNRTVIVGSFDQIICGNQVVLSLLGIEH
jgi:hypothetical protein